MNTYTVGQAMNLKSEPICFAIDRPNVIDSYIFLHFINPVDIRIGNKVVHTTENACMIYPPQMPQYYVAGSVPLLHNYIHFNINNMKEYKEVELPLGVLFSTTKQYELTKMVEEIELNLLLNINNFENRRDDFPLICSSLLHDIFTYLHQDLELTKNIKYYSITANFEKVRKLMYENPSEWNVDKMANAIPLSRSRFSVKYRQIFGISPNEDIMEAALQLAERLLINSKKTIADIAHECGFNSTEYFIRLFHGKKGSTPGNFRKGKQKTGL